MKKWLFLTSKNYLSVLFSALIAVSFSGIMFAYSQQETFLGEDVGISNNMELSGDLHVAGVIRGYVVPTHITWTDITHHGDFGGYKAMNDWIQKNGCPGYHVCDADEVTRYQQSVGPINAPLSWVWSFHHGGSWSRHECYGWSRAELEGKTFSGNYQDNMKPVYHGCGNAYHVLCCKY